MLVFGFCVPLSTIVGLVMSVRRRMLRLMLGAIQQSLHGQFDASLFVGFQHFDAHHLAFG